MYDICDVWNPNLTLRRCAFTFPMPCVHLQCELTAGEVWWAVMLMGALIYRVHYGIPEYVCTLLVAGGVSVFALFKVRNAPCSTAPASQRCGEGSIFVVLGSGVQQSDSEAGPPQRPAGVRPLLPEPGDGRVHERHAGLHLQKVSRTGMTHSLSPSHL